MSHRAKRRSVVIACALLPALSALTACKDRTPLSISQKAHAQASEQQSGAGLPEADAALNCFESATTQLQMNERTAFHLCRGAASSGPVQCYQTARQRTRLVDYQILILCRCAISSAPVTCFERGAKTTYLLDDQLLALCSATNTQQTRGNCVPYN